MYQSWIDTSKHYSTDEGTVPNKTTVFSFGGYLIVGGNVTCSFNNEYFDKGMEEIWR